MTHYVGITIKNANEHPTDVSGLLYLPPFNSMDVLQTGVYCTPFFFFSALRDK